MAYKIVHKSLKSIKADVIVNAANTKPICTPGCEMELYVAADAEKMLDARRMLGEIEQGKAASTEAYNLMAARVIHTAMPRHGCDNRAKEKVLRNCYRNSFKLAGSFSCKSIAVPIFMLDSKTFPKRKAIEIAMGEVTKYLSKNDITIYIAVPQIDEFVLPDNLMQDIDSLLYYEGESYGGNSLQDTIEKETESFGECFFRLVDEKGLTDATVYNKANVNRKVISKLRIKPDRNVDKKTAIALAIGLELDINDTEYFLKLAGFALSPRIKFDRIVRYFIESGKYDIQEINEALFKYTERVLVGADK
ncbi:O-acetyl-ADP-ribose deacetylase (regulator of RNase III), contains Macro domain [Butyrivibrio sp. INlla18]|uniref:macro domain-containing protein n=1 Tax=Butyrivibrio sp. INlla18 TaxID=1520806 RepID=UPI0008852CD9|nr:macro domain-containing protein [Butyrivibrio sp. INlla18]SDA57903.1 O-acetyl-ADP-ribose deacetylase (regulator of RNase III), contains Macro domain [Butyrivibrio sp. INlla18]